MYIYIYIYIYTYAYASEFSPRRFLFLGGQKSPRTKGGPPNFPARVRPFSLLETPGTSIESLDESAISRWSLEVLSMIFRFLLKSRLWNRSTTSQVHKWP